MSNVLGRLSETVVELQGKQFASWQARHDVAAQYVVGLHGVYVVRLALVCFGFRASELASRMAEPNVKNRTLITGANLDVMRGMMQPFLAG